MRMIELHILQSFPVTCLNRDDVGAPKSAVFGGVPRARVSSQCWKRAIRMLAGEERPESFAGMRGHFHAEPLRRKLVEKDIPEEKAEELASQAVEFLGKKDSKYKGEGVKTSVALYLSPMELEGIAEEIALQFRESGKADIKRGAVKKALQKVPARDTADIAIFGRMVADDHSLMLEGAGMFSHALSTHKVTNEVDFFSAVDDLKPEESEGAGHIGDLEFNSACYYRYVGVNWDLLSDTDHLGHLSDEERTEVLGAFLRAAVLAVPGARHNSMLGHNPPAFVLGLVRDGQPLSLVNAFESPLRPGKPTGESERGGYVGSSIEKLEGHWSGISDLYGFQASEHRLPPEKLDDFIGGISSDV